MPSSSFDWNDLQFFLAVARSGTISAAGRRLGVDHATVSRRVAALEEALEAKLFERNLRGYNLTHTGERLLSSAEAIEAEAQHAERQVAADGQRVSGTVRISTLEGFGNYFLAPRLPALAAAHPNLSVELVSIQQIIALSRREADVVVTLRRPDGDRFVAEPLTDYALFVYGARDYLERTGTPRTVAELGGHPFAGYIEELIFTRGLDYLDDIVPGLRPRLQCSSLHAQMATVAAGFGLAVLPAFVADPQPSLVRVLPDQASLVRTYWLVSHTEVAEVARVRLARRFIREQVAAARDRFLGSAA
ncbi:LysR family transcriptional regulator [Azospirillum sp. RWY-5-1]|uniref:LysR family transcriptional regulator n=1 Tax=Azospirillum oleiclasticum TaxID=2735135 RepID=A0ABX2TCU8_9PROT|nr:LysR family transcriptional regulator [Azospirillum oleiclasticum]NYZ13750.1 LysR family transcriptional regulator [Azospirillum oleiclasticum]NYZ21022.1 LysR family transcriptional regulator [Azospirillum oleiclasticum]